MDRGDGGPATAQWKALPNYVSLVRTMFLFTDVSGSMRGRPMATSVGLAIYFAEHNQWCIPQSLYDIYRPALGLCQSKVRHFEKMFALLNGQELVTTPALKPLSMKS